MPTTRLSLTPSIDNRNAVNNKDAIGYNCIYETIGEGKRVLKRPGLYQLPLSPALPTGEGQGLFHWNSYLIAGQSGGLYGIIGSTTTLFGSIPGTQTPFSFCQTAHDQYLVINNGANLYTVNKTGNVFGTAVVNSIVGSVVITNGGSGYITTPAVTFSAPPSGTTATGTAVVSNDIVTGVTITNGGTGYVVAPTVTIGPPTATTITATGTASITNITTWNYYFAPQNLYLDGWIQRVTSIAVNTVGYFYPTSSSFTVTASYFPSVAGIINGTKTTGVIASGYCTVNNGRVSSFVITSAVDIYITGNSNTYPTNVTVSVAAPPSANTSQATANAVMTSGSPDILGPYAYGLVYLNSRVFVMTTSGTIYQSAIDNPTSWNSSEWIYANSDPDDGVAIARHLNYLVAFGQWSTQFFYDAGNPVGNVLSAYQTAKLEIGCAAGPSVANAEHTVIWVGQGLTEGRGVYLLDGTTPKKVSTVHVDRILNSNQALTGTHAFCAKVAGHTLYILTITSSNITLVYDLEEQEWYRWTSQSGGIETYFKPTYFNGNVEYSPNLYMQHEENGQVYVMNPDYYDDHGDAIYFRARTKNEDNGTTKRKFYRRVEVVGDKTPATLSIRHSDDDYQTWSTNRIVNLLDSRPILYQNGSARRRAWEVFSDSLQPIRIESLELDIDIAE